MAWWGGAALFLAGLLAPSLKTLVDELVLTKVRSKETQKQLAASRADEAAVLCYQALGELGHGLPSLRRAERSRRSSESEEVKLKELVADQLRILDLNIVFLPRETRLRMAEILDILEVSEDLTFRNRWTFFGPPHHPHAESTLVHNMTSHGRDVLAALRRGDSLPPVTQGLIEYRIAPQEWQLDRETEFAEEIHETNAELQEWREAHGVTGNEFTQEQ